jgi:stress-induced morphogen
MSPQQVEQLKQEFEKRFQAVVETEPVDGNGRYRFAVVSPQFESMTHLQRQDALWEVVGQILSREASLDISLILAFSASEIGVHSGGDLMRLLAENQSP